MTSLSHALFSSLPKPPPLTFGTHLDAESLATWARSVEAETQHLTAAVEASLAPRAAAFSEATALLPVISDRLCELQQQISEVGKSLSSSASLSTSTEQIVRLQQVISVLQEISSIDNELVGFGLEPELHRRVDNFRVLADRIGNLKNFPISTRLADRLQQVCSLLEADVVDLISSSVEICRLEISGFSVVFPERRQYSVDDLFSLALKIGSSEALMDSLVRKFLPLLRELFVERSVASEAVDFDFVDDRKFVLRSVENPHRVVHSEFPINAFVLMFEFLSLQWKNPQMKIKFGKKISDLFPGNTKVQRGLAVHGFFYSTRFSDQISDQENLAALRHVFLRPGGAVGARIRGWALREELAEISDSLVPEVISDRLLNSLEFCNGNFHPSAILLLAEISRFRLEQQPETAEAALITNDLLFLSYLAAARDLEISLIFHVRKYAEYATEYLVPGNFKQRKFQEVDLPEIVKVVSGVKRSVEGVLTEHTARLLDEQIVAQIFPSFLRNVVESQSVSAGVSVGKLKNLFPKHEDLRVAHLLLTGNSQQIVEGKGKGSEELNKESRKLLALNPLLNEGDIKQLLLV